MKIVSVKASQSYEVVIGEGLLTCLGKHLLQICSKCKVAVISDTNVWPIYGNAVVKSLTDSGYEAIHYAFEAGEASKNPKTYIQILNFLAENKITRSDLIIALGGGVVGDATGFAAATYLRGMKYVQIPTSLLAMVDSSVGGKTAIDLPAGKNLVGAFKQPVLVLCDVSTLNSLPQEVFLDGCAEVIKYGILYDKTLFHYLQKTGVDFDRESVIAKCVAYKCDVVQEDEFDTGVRQKLNLGHTIGHGIEAASEYRMSHGRAVAAGMAIVAKAAAKYGYCDKSVYEDICNTLQRFSLPCETKFSAHELYQSALSDKKRTGGTVNLIIPRNIGCCDIVPTPVAELKSFIEAGL